MIYLNYSDEDPSSENADQPEEQDTATSSDNWDDTGNDTSSWDSFSGSTWDD